VKEKGESRNLGEAVDFRIAIEALATSASWLNRKSGTNQAADRARREIDRFVGYY